MWGMSGHLCYDIGDTLGSCDMDVTLEVLWHEHHTWGLMTWASHLRCYDMGGTLEVLWPLFVVTQHSFSDSNHVMIQVCHDATVFSDLIHVMDTGFVVTQQCFPNFNPVMIQVCHDATMFFRFHPCHGYRSCGDTTVFIRFQLCHDTSLVVT